MATLSGADEVDTSHDKVVASDGVASEDEAAEEPDAEKDAKEGTKEAADTKEAPDTEKAPGDPSLVVEEEVDDGEDLNFAEDMMAMDDALQCPLAGPSPLNTQVVAVMKGNVGRPKGKADNADDGTKLCKVCGLGEKKDRQQFGSCCEADVRAARRDAQSQGPATFNAFKRLQKLGNTEFITAIQTYRAKCQGNGRGWKRPAFAWAAYTMAIEAASRVQVGTKQMWLTKRAFINFIVQTEGCPEPMAQQRWMVEIENAGPGKVNSAKTEILWPVEKFVMDFHEKSHTEKVEMGTKQIKKSK